MLHQMHLSLIRALGYSPRSSLCNADCILQTGVRTISTANEPNVIRIPVKMVEKIEKYQNTKKRREREMTLKRSHQGKKSVPIISCKRHEFNHYHGQTYSKFQEIQLASKGWGHRKAAGDYFTINSYGPNPAFVPVDDETPNFDSLGLRKDLLTQITKLGFQTPTNIQTLAIPQVLEGKNTLITAETGNGKTLAFLAPMLQQIARHKQLYEEDMPRNTPLGLIIVPGRELAEQIHDVASTLGSDMGISVEVVKGGRTKVQMLHPKLKEVHLLVATIGALSKLTTTGVYNTNLVRHIVIDEADSLFDDSFNEKLLYYMSRFPIQGARSEDSTQPLALSGCQLTLVSATMPRSLHTILDPVVDMESVEKISTPYLHRIMPHVPQRFFRVSDSTKATKLLELVKKDKANGTPVVIFSNYNKTSNWVSLFLNENNIPCVNLNGDMHAAIREGRFDQFQSGEVLALSCTDLTSRGLDTVRAGHIINFEFPRYMSDYIHRCGRTGRVGSSTTGLVTNLVKRPREIELVQNIEYAARKTKELHNVNANIKRTLMNRFIGQEETSG